MKRRVAKNRCCRCDKAWTDLPMGFARHDRCPACGSFYWVWTDYAEQSAGRMTPAVNLLAVGRRKKSREAS